MRGLIPLLLAGSLSLGCATAHAQEGEEHAKEEAAALERAHEAEKHAKEMSERVDELAERAREAEGRERAELHLEIARLLWKLERREPAILHAELSVDSDPHYEPARKALEEMREAAVERSHSFPRRTERWDPRRPRAGTEERLERLERAVHDMTRLLEHHGVGPAARDRALREMHARRGPPPRRGRMWFEEAAREYGERARMPRFEDPERGRLAAHLWMRQIDEAVDRIHAAKGDEAAQTLADAARRLTKVADEMGGAARGRAEGRRGPRGPGPRGREHGRRPGHDETAPPPRRGEGRGRQERAREHDPARIERELQEREHAVHEMERHTVELRELLERQRTEAEELRRHIKELEERLKKAEDE